MTNSYILPLEGNDAQIETDGFVSGRDINYEVLIASGKLLNYSNAYLGSGPIINQQWNGGLCYYSNGSTYKQIVRYLVPSLSRQHNNFHTIIRAKATSGSNIRWRVVRSSGLEQLFNVGASVSNSYLYNSLSFTVTSSTIGYYEFILEVIGTVDIESISVENRPLSSPLSPTNTISYTTSQSTLSIYSVGDTMFGEDSPLSTPKAGLLIDNIYALNRRPRCLFSWSGLDTYTTSITNPFNTKTIRPQKGMIFHDIDKINRGLIGLPYWLNSDSMTDLRYTVAIYNANVPYDCILTLFGRDIPLDRNKASQWNKFTFRGVPDQLDQIEDTSLSTPLIKFTFDSIYNEGYLTNSTPILALCIWGW